MQCIVDKLDSVGLVQRYASRIDSLHSHMLLHLILVLDLSISFSYSQPMAPILRDSVDLGLAAAR
jgi:hypothetical protein